MTPVFVDTPVWRDYFTGRNPELGDHVDELITQRLVRVSGAVMQEVLSQARTPAECERLAKALLGGYDGTAAGECVIAVTAGRIACRLHAEGHAPLAPLRVLSAAAAVTARAPLLTSDTALHVVARFFPLKILCA